MNDTPTPTSPTIQFQAECAASETRDVTVAAADEGAPYGYNTLIIETHMRFDLTGFLVDGQRQLVNDSPVPASAFQPGVEDHLRLKLDPIKAGTLVTLRVRNRHDTPTPFRARLLALPPRSS
jgi:hypothetical protein